MRVKVVQFIAIITTALYLVPTGAHLFELLNKIALTPTEYLTVQKIYAGWSLFGVVVGVACWRHLRTRCWCAPTARPSHGRWEHLSRLLGRRASSGRSPTRSMQLPSFGPCHPTPSSWHADNGNTRMQPALCSHLRRSSRLSWQCSYITQMLKGKSFSRPNDRRDGRGHAIDHSMVAVAGIPLPQTTSASAARRRLSRNEVRGRSEVLARYLPSVRGPVGRGGLDSLSSPERHRKAGRSRGRCRCER